MKQRISLLASGLLLLAGCTMGPQAPLAGTGATLILKPEVVSAAYRTQAPPSIAPYSHADVSHVMVKLYIVSAGVETPVVREGASVTRIIQNANLAEDVVFDRLQAQTTYRVKCEAYKVEPSLIRLISTQDADSYTDIVVTNDDRPTVGALKVKLKAKPFSGEGSFQMDVHDGDLAGGGSETLKDGGSAT